MLTIIILLALFIATYTDTKTKTIPVFLFPSVLVLGVLCLIHNGNLNLLSSFIFGIFAFISYLVLALFFHGGGGDVIMMTSLAFLLGKEILYIMFIGHTILCIVSLVRYIRTKKKETLPFTPFVLVAYIIYLIGGFFV